jgi:FAD synthetase
MKNKTPAQGWSALGGKKVMVFGTFDIFHEGHKDFFRQAKEHGDLLIVVVARDKNVLEAKNSLPENNELARQKKISESKLADNVVLGDLNDKYKAIKEYKPDVICLGYDQAVMLEELNKKLSDLGLKETQVVRLNSFHPEMYKSSILRKRHKKMA